MSRNLTKSPILLTAVIVGLVAATALVAGYVDRPSGDAQIAAAQSQCEGCPAAGTDQCCKAEEKASCSSDTACALSEKAECKDDSGCSEKKCGGCASKGGCGGGQCSVEESLSI